MAMAVFDRKAEVLMAERQTASDMAVALDSIKSHTHANSTS
jgi:hypothetical protein